MKDDQNLILLSVHQQTVNCKDKFTNKIVLNMIVKYELNIRTCTSVKGNNVNYIWTTFGKNVFKNKGDFLNAAF